MLIRDLLRKHFDFSTIQTAIPTAIAQIYILECRRVVRIFTVANNIV